MKLTNEEKALCEICNRPRHEHGGFKHEFVSYGEAMTLRLAENGNDRAQSSHDSSRTGPEGRLRIASTGDPVLRMALIRAGVITVQDIDNVEAELRVSGAASYEPPATVG